MEHLLTLQPHRDTHLTYNTRMLIVAYLTDLDTTTLDVCYYDRNWLGAPTKEE